MPDAVALDWMHWLVRMVFIGIFIPSAFGKLRAWAAFVDGVVAYQILPVPLARAFGWALPLLELLCAAGLLWAPTVALSSLGISLLLIAFSIAISSNLQRGRRMACFCTGAQQTHPISWGMVGRNLLLLLGGGLLLLHPAAAALPSWGMSDVLLFVILIGGVGVLVPLVEHSIDLTLRLQRPS